MPLEIIFNKPHPSIFLHIKDATTQEVLIMLLQETKRDIIFRHAKPQEARRQEDLNPRIQAHLVLVVNKITSLLEYQGTLIHYLSCREFSRMLSILTPNSFPTLSPIHITHFHTSISYLDLLCCD